MPLTNFNQWNKHENYGPNLIHEILNFRMRTLTLWQGDFDR